MDHLEDDVGLEHYADECSGHPDVSEFLEEYLEEPKEKEVSTGSKASNSKPSATKMWKNYSPSMLKKSISKPLKSQTKAQKIENERNKWEALADAKLLAVEKNVQMADEKHKLEIALITKEHEEKMSMMKEEHEIKMRIFAHKQTLSKNKLDSIN